MVEVDVDMDHGRQKECIANGYNRQKGVGKDCTSVYCSQSTYLGPTQPPGLTKLYPKLEKIQTLCEYECNMVMCTHTSNRKFVPKLVMRISLLSGWLPLLNENATMLNQLLVHAAFTILGIVVPEWSELQMKWEDLRC